MVRGVIRGVGGIIGIVDHDWTFLNHQIFPQQLKPAHRPERWAFTDLCLPALPSPKPAVCAVRLEEAESPRN